MPGEITTQQAVRFTESLAGGQKDAFGIIQMVLTDKTREVL